MKKKIDFIKVKNKTKKKPNGSFEKAAKCMRKDVTDRFPVYTITSKLLIGRPQMGNFKMSHNSM